MADSKPQTIGTGISQKAQETLNKLLKPQSTPEGKAMNLPFHRKVQELISKLPIQNLESIRNSTIMEAKFGDIFSKLITGRNYSRADMVQGAEAIFLDDASFNIKKQLLVAISLDSVDVFLKENPKDTETKFIVLEEVPKLWVCMAITKTFKEIKEQPGAVIQQWKIFYKNFTGEPMDNYVLSFLKTTNIEINKDAEPRVRFEFLDQCSVECVHNEDKESYKESRITTELTYDYSGPITLRALKDLKRAMKNTPEDFLKDKFYKISQIQSDVLTTLSFHARKLYNSCKFGENYKRISGQFTDTNHIWKRVELFCEEATAENYHELRKKYLKISEIERATEGLNDELADEIESFQIIGRIISCSSADPKDYYEGVITGFCDIFKFLKHANLRIVFGNLQPPVIPVNTIGPCEATASIGEEIKIDLDARDKLLQFYLSDWVNSESLKGDTTRIANAYEESKMYQMTCDQIRGWALQVRGTFSKQHDRASFAKEMAKVLAGFGLSIGNRDYLCPALIYLCILSNDSNGLKLLEIKNPELKIYVVALLAVVKVLQGYKVDITTNTAAQAKQFVDMTKKIYNVFGISVTNLKGQYSYDVVYLPLEAFQFDYLQENLEGIPTRGKRGFGHLIINETDSLMVNEEANVAKLCESFPSMSNLRYVYISIWTALRKAETQFVKDTNEGLKTKIISVVTSVKSQGFTELTAQNPYEDFLEVCMSSEMKTLEEETLKLAQQEQSFVPQHLVDYVTSKMTRWVKSAIYAKFFCSENRHYSIENGKIAPFDQRRGISYGVWTDGLHQFLELKHGLRVTCEKPKSSFISNVAYFENYGHQCITCVTGGLGSQNELNFLRGIYQTLQEFRLDSPRVEDSKLVSISHPVYVTYVQSGDKILALDREQCRQIVRKDPQNRFVKACIQWSEVTHYK